jgi:flavin-dependent dehydrogenase
VTGPLAYDRLSSDFISIGDAAGMVDPFCGEGMRHALDTGLCAARVIAAGVKRGQSYELIRARYENDSSQRWRGKRRLGKIIRHMLKHPRLTAFGLGLNPEYWFRQLWD